MECMAGFAEEAASCPAPQEDCCYLLSWVLSRLCGAASAEVALRGWGFVSSDDGPMGLGSAFVESIQQGALDTQGFLQTANHSDPCQ